MPRSKKYLVITVIMLAIIGCVTLPKSASEPAVPIKKPTFTATTQPTDILGLTGIPKPTDNTPPTKRRNEEGTTQPPPPPPTEITAPTDTSTPSVLPDLTISQMGVKVSGMLHWTGCVTTYGRLGVGVEVHNIGSADARPFTVELNGVNQQVVVGGLPVGQKKEVFFVAPEGVGTDQMHDAIVDATNQVIESNENNNVAEALAVTPTPPSTCTPSSLSTP